MAGVSYQGHGPEAPGTRGPPIYDKLCPLSYLDLTQVNAGGSLEGLCVRFVTAQGPAGPNHFAQWRDRLLVICDVKQPITASPHCMANCKAGQDGSKNVQIMAPCMFAAMLNESDPRT